jgi:SAM-dependent methyltransferase
VTATVSFIRLRHQRTAMLSTEASTEARAREAYEGWHRRVESETAAGESPWHHLVARQLTPALFSRSRVLEIGCGRGEFVRRLIDAFGAPRQFVAADFAASAVQLGRGRLRPGHQTGVSWAVASIQDIPLADRTFDIVISCETIEHVVDPVKALRELHRVLRPGGTLMLTTPNYLGPMGLYRAYLRAVGRRYTEGGQPICHLTSLPRTMAWPRRAGFRVRHVDASGHYAPWPGRQPFELSDLDRVRWLRWFALHALVVAERP